MPEAFLDKSRHSMYIKDGRTFEEGFDCYGFVRAYFHYVRGIELPDVVRGMEDLDRMPRMEVLDHFAEGSIVRLQSFSSTEHVGVYHDGYVYHFDYNGLIAADAQRLLNRKRIVKGIYNVA